MSTTPLPSTRATVTLIPAATKAINELMEATGLSQTDVINRAVQISAFISGATANGAKLMLQQPDGSMERIHIV